MVPSRVLYCTMIIYPFRYNFLFSLELISLPLRVVVLSIYHYFILNFSAEVKPVSTLHSLFSALLWRWWVSRPVALLVSSDALYPHLWHSLDHSPVSSFPNPMVDPLQSLLGQGSWGWPVWTVFIVLLHLVDWGSCVGILGWKSFCPRDFEDVASF